MAPSKTDLDENSDGENLNTSTVSVEGNHEPEKDLYFEPVVTLPKVEVKTNEENEKELLKLRCKLFRYFTVEAPSEWKERGTGFVKILHHEDNKKVRLLMRQEKTLKVRANHYISPFMELKSNCSSDRVWVWSVRADFADEVSKAETFAIKFANKDSAALFKEKFEYAKGVATVAVVKEIEKECSKTTESCDDTADAMQKLTVSEESKNDN